MASKEEIFFENQWQKQKKKETIKKEALEEKKNKTKEDDETPKEIRSSGDPISRRDVTFRMELPSFFYRVSFLFCC